MRYSLIVAYDKNFLVGKGNTLPWHCPEDLKWFVSKTRHKAILMGSKTANGIGKLLPNRFNIVLTTNPENITYPDPVIATTTAEAIFKAKNYGYYEMVICGGPTLYDQFLPQVDKIYLTQLEGEYEGDVYLENTFLKQLGAINGVRDNYQGWVLEELKVIEGVGSFKTFIKVQGPHPEG